VWTQKNFWVKNFEVVDSGDLEKFLGKKFGSGVLGT
jgi:hypothetical protein